MPRWGRWSSVALVVPLVLTLGALPTVAADRDGDLLRDGFETKWGVTSPDDPDSDDDGVVDSAEDNDQDRLGNLGEQRFGTDPGRRDTDRDGIPDGREDNDGDGKSNAREQDRRRVPPGLRPSLRDANSDVSPHKDDCQTRRGDSTLTMCRFGPGGSGKTVVLVGDSNAMMILPPIKAVAEERGWRLITLVKTACAPVLGIRNSNRKWASDQVSCRAWRRNVIEWLNANLPDHVILSHSGLYPLADYKGRRLTAVKAEAAWRRGMERTLAAMPGAAKVLVMGDVPENRLNPVRCLKKHPKDISACTTAKTSVARRSVARALKQATRSSGARFRSVYGKVCSYDPCPIIQGNVLLWRDRGHYTTTFAKQLTPTFRALLTDVIGPASRKR